MRGDWQDEVRSQFRVHAVLGGLLYQQLHDARLPLMRWTVLRNMLLAEPAASGDQARTAAIEAWAARLELPVEKSTMPGELPKLTAGGPYTPTGGETIHVALSANLYGSDGIPDR